MSFTKSYLQSSLIKTDITAFDILNNDSLFICNENTLILHDFKNNIDQVIYAGFESDDLNSLKHFNKRNILFASNDNFLHLFDYSSNKQISKYIFMYLFN